VPRPIFDGVKCISLVSSALIVAACTVIHNARLYDLASANVLVASYKSNGSGHGSIWIGETEQSATCRGEYVTVPAGSTGWGTIFGTGGPSVIAARVLASDGCRRGRARVGEGTLC
jgi:hypothetical protein